MSENRSWTEEQKILFECVQGMPRLKRVAVSADAGAGKTSVLVERIRRLPTDKRVLCVSFTEKSKADLEDRLSDLLHVEVYTIHGFCMRVVTEFGSQIGLPPVFRIIADDEIDDLFYGAFERVYRRSPPGNVDHGVDVFYRLCERAREVGDAVNIIEAAADAKPLSAFVREVLNEFELSKKMTHVLEYADLEKLAATLLKREPVAQILRQRFSHVFVDEFQDTSHVQCALVNAICHVDSPLFVVGDVKQSIYRFRGADVRVFEQFVEELPEKRRLSANFRSHHQVIDAVNAVCAQVVGGYEPMQAARVEKETAAVWSKVPRVARVTAENDALAIESIVRKLRAEGVPLSDIVLLTRRMRGNEKLFAELASRGICVAATSSSSSSSDETLGKLLNLWIWACEPWQRLRAARVLVDFPWVFEREEAIPPAELRARLGEQLAKLVSPLESAELSSCEKLLKTLDERFELKERFGATCDQFQVFVLRHQSEGLSPAQLARRLDRLLLNEKSVSGFVLLPPPSNLAGTIRALTIHGSKGLEFPVVILADVGPKRARSQSFFSREQRIWLPGRDDEGKLDWSDPVIQEQKEAEAGDELAESARLLYVAMTRAKEALYVVDRAEKIIDDSVAPKKTKKKPDTSWSAWLKAGIERSIPMEEFARGALTKAQMAEPVRLDVAARALEGAEPIYTRARIGVSELSAKLAAANPPLEISQRPQRSSNTGVLSVEQAKQLGTDIHRLLELGDWDGLRARAQTVGVNLDPFWKWLKSNEGQAVFGQPRDVKKRVFNEFAFEWKTREGVVTGRLDRLVVFETAAWIVDYKIILGAKSAEDLLASYGPQLRIYADAVKTLTKTKEVRAFLIDVACATGSIWREVDCANPVLC